MSSIKLHHLRKGYPSEEEAIGRLESLLDNWGDSMVFDLDTIYEKVHPTSYESLAVILGELVDYGFLTRTVWVVSPQSHLLLEEFSSLNDVPDVIFDFSRDEDMEVTEEYIGIKFKKAS